MAWRNPNDNPAQITNAFQGLSITDHIIGAFLNLGPLTGVERTGETLFPYIYLASRGESWLRASGANRGDYALAIAIMNAIAPTTSLHALSTARARSRFRLEVIALLCHELALPTFYDISQEAYNTAKLNVTLLGVVANLLPADIGTLSGDHAHALIDREELTPLICSNILEWMVERGTNRLKKIGTIMYCVGWTALALRGVVSDDKAGKLNDQLTGEGCPNPGISERLINIVYTPLSQCVDETTAQEVFTTWSGNIGDRSLRLRLILNQTVGSGLTAILVIKKAMLDYPDFPWVQAFAYLPGECTRVQQAMNAIGDNPYYGFANDLGAAKSTLYRSIAYVAKEILIRHGGPTCASLSHYRGWTRNPVNKEKLDELIAAFDPVENLVLPDEDGEDLTILRDTMGAANHLVM